MNSTVYIVSDVAVRLMWSKINVTPPCPSGEGTLPLLSVPPQTV